MSQSPSLDNSIKNVAEDTGQLISSASHRTAEKVIKHSEKYSDAYSAMNKIIENFWERVPYIFIALVVFLLFWLLSRFFKYFIRKTLFNRAYTKQNLVMVLCRVGSTVILFFGFLIALVIIIPGFSPAQLVSALGIGSVAIGFAFKDIFQNMLSGILILISEPFRIGDTIVINNFEGTVEDIQIRATFIKSYDGRRIVIPNATVYTSPITVNTAYSKRRCEFIVGIGYHDDIARASQIIQEVLKTDAKVLAEPKFTVEVASLAEFTVNLMVRWWIDTDETNIPHSISHIQSLVKHAFDEQGISMPYPTREVTISNLPQLIPDAAPSQGEQTR